LLSNVFQWVIFEDKFIVRMKKDTLINDINDEAFIVRITNIAIIMLLSLVIPLLIYTNFFSIANSFYHPVTVWSNYILLTALILVIPFYKFIPHKVKRGIFFSILFYFGAKSLYFGNLEFTYTVYVVMVTFTILTSSVRTSILILAIAISAYISFPVLSYFKLISFYQDPVAYHTNFNIILVRTLESLLGVSFMSAIIFYVFKNNKKNLSLLQKKVIELDILNNNLLQEVAERKKAELQAEDYANNFLTLYNSSYDGYMILSEDYTIVDINQSVVNISGYEKKEIVGLNSLYFLGDEYKKIIDDRRDKLLNGDKLPDLTIDALNKAGERLVMQTQMVVIKKNDVVSFLVVVKDVTEETIANEALLKNEQLFRTLFENSSDSILLMNDGELIQHNTVAKEFYACLNSKNCCLRTCIRDINKSDDINNGFQFSEKVKLALNGQNQSFEWVHSCADRSPTYSLVSIQALPELGPEYYMVVEKNITERKRNQNLILNSVIQTEENERKRISSDLHDGIGPILTTIKLYTQALLDTTVESKKKVISDKLIGLVDEAVNSISEISFNISPHILVNYGFVAAVEAFIKKFGLSDKLEIHFKHNGVSRFDENKEITMYRLFTELMNNTIKHSRATKVDFDIFETEKEIKLYYKDNGVGFNPDEVTLNSLRMGLGNLKNRIQSFNGQFNLLSAPNKGMEVSILLPKVDSI